MLGVPLSTVIDVVELWIDVANVFLHKIEGRGAVSDHFILADIVLLGFVIKHSFSKKRDKLPVRHILFECIKSIQLCLGA